MSDAALAPRGLHHATAFAGDPQENIDFYVGVLGLRLVKRSVNQDAPDTYHLFYADGDGTPGTDLTFFPMPGVPGREPGVGQIVELGLGVPTGSLDYWEERLRAHDVTVRERETRFGEATLPFVDPHGLWLALVATDDARDGAPWTDSPVPATHQIKGMHAARLWERTLGPTETLLTDVMGFEKLGEENGWHRYSSRGGHSGSIVDIELHPNKQRSRGGPGSMHHIAWRMRDDAHELATRAAVQDAGLRPTEQIDRFWFRSVYFREPGGALFELATDDPGFTRDEAADALGEALILPPWLEEKRDQIEAALPPLTIPRPTPARASE
ncbi:ring-cleaving dioxygenase [Salisaeta longa]|uniref:ring-cleaving dioxygenase n=1 Tax=Salisaeta longa TaxID=503170 RepID=UPI0003B40FF8|nr:ring-cleaving dioxygenase [Salisaeta longa]